MKQLWILRHAHAEPFADEATDFERRLDKRGVREAEAMAALAGSLQLQFERVVVSPAARTLATAQQMAQVLAIPLRHVHADERIYLAQRKTLVAIVRALPDECGSVLLVGHNPGVSRLVRWLTDDDGIDELRPATLVGVAADLRHWSDADAGLFERLRVLRPEDADRR